MSQNVFDNRYRYDHIYPRGRSGETLRAWDTQDNDRPVVIKRPAPQDAPPMRAAQQVSILAEKKALERLTGHPCLTELRQSGSFKVGPQSHTYIVMDRAEGEIVADRVHTLSEQGERIPVLEMLLIVDKLLDLLMAAHEQQVVYNDVDAKHLFWDRENYRLKVIDWGNAVMLDMSGSASNVNPQTDVYQVGELLYFLLTGGSRLDSETTPDGEHVVVFGEDAAHISPTLQAIITRATHPVLRRRYGRMYDLRQALTEFRQPLEVKRDEILSEVRRALTSRQSKQSLEDLATRLDDAQVMAPGYPETRRLKQEIIAALQRLEVQAAIDVGRIYLDSANWSRAGEVMQELLDDADERIAPAVRFIIVAAEYLAGQKRSEPVPVLNAAITALIDEMPQRAGQLLLEPPVMHDHLMLAERLAATDESVQLLRPHITRLRMELDAMNTDAEKARQHLETVENTLKSPPENFGLRFIRQQYQTVGEALAQMEKPVQALSQNISLDRLEQPLHRAQQAVAELQEALTVVSRQAYSEPGKAGEALRRAGMIDPLNAYFTELNDYFDEIHQAVEALGTFKPGAKGEALSGWFERVLNFMQGYGDDLEDQALQQALQALQTTSQYWQETVDGFILGRHALVKNRLNEMVNLMKPLNHYVAEWFEGMAGHITSSTRVEQLSLNSKLGERLIEGYQVWGQGKFEEVKEMAQRMVSMASTDSEVLAVDRLVTLSRVSDDWIQQDGIHNYDLTDQLEREVLACFLPEENSERDNFASQMPSTDVYLKTMSRGLVETMRLSSSAGLQLLFLHYVWRGTMCLQKDELNDAQFWRDAALKTLTGVRTNPIFVAFNQQLGGRQLILEAQSQLNAVQLPGDLTDLRPLLNQAAADQWLGDIQQVVRQLEVVIRHWDEGEFKEARALLDSILTHLTEIEADLNMDVASFRAWVTRLRDGAADIQEARLKIEQIANTTKKAISGEPPDPILNDLFRQVTNTTESILGGDYGHQLRQWLMTYRAIRDTHTSTESKADKLAAFDAHFNSLFINRHPAYRLFQVWQQAARELPDVVETTVEGEGEWIDSDAPVYEEESEAAVSPHVPTFEDDKPESGRREAPAPTYDSEPTSSIPWGTIIALVIVIVGIIAFVVWLGSGEDDNDNQSQGAVAPTATVTPLPPTRTPSPTATDVPTDTPMPSTSTPSPTEIPPTATPTPEIVVTTAVPTLDDGSQIALNFGQDALANFGALSSDDYGWTNTEWFQPGAGGEIWQLGASGEEGSGPIVVVFPAEFIERRFGPQSAQRIRAIEVEMELVLYDDALLDSGIYFGVGLQDSNRRRASAEMQLTEIEPNVIRPRYNENGQVRRSPTRPAGSVIKVRLRLERTSEGTILYLADGQMIGQSEEFFEVGAVLSPVLYTSGGGIFVQVLSLEFDFGLE